MNTGLTSYESAWLDRAVRALRPSDRKMLILSRLHGMTHAQIARDLGLSEEAVRKALVRILMSLARSPVEPR